MIDYRRFTGSRDLRQKILSGLSWVPDKLMLRVQFLLQTGRMLNLKNPTKFQDLIQAYKLYYRNPEMHRCVDKYAVREFIKDKGLGHTLVPLLGVYDKVEDIDFDKLPDKFVVKSTDGSGNNQTKVCRGKTPEIIEEIKEAAQKWLSAPRPRKHGGREWAYDNDFPRRIIIEEYLEENNDTCPEGKDKRGSDNGISLKTQGTKGKKTDVDDYKFFCYDGKYRILEWHKDRSCAHKAAHYDERGEMIPDVKIYPEPFGDHPLPENFNEMVEIAERLSEGFPFVRVDLYNVNGKIYFGEMTFYPASGYFVYVPEETNDRLGSFFTYPFKSVR